MDNKNTPIINIENIHIHLDERMFSKNFYNPTESCCDECDGCIGCDECSDCDDGIEISDEELMVRIHNETNIPIVLIDRILKAEDKVLAQVYAERMEDEDDTDCDEDAESEEDEPSGDHTPEPSADKNPASDASKALAALAGLTLVNILRGIVSEKEETANES